MDPDLRLQGDKIKLESRPSSRESTASSKSAYLLQGPTRPVSAMPMLSLYKQKDDFEMISSRGIRPYSANNLIRTNSESSDAVINEIPTIRVEDINELPSTDILKALINEPLVSWRNGCYYEPTSNEKQEKPKTPKTDDEKEILQLTPGIMEKPPLPPNALEKVKDVRFSEFDDISEFSDEKSEDTSSIESNIQYESWFDDEIEKHTDVLMEKLKLDMEDEDKNEIDFDKFFSEFASEKIDVSDKCISVEKIKPPTQKLIKKKEKHEKSNNLKTFKKISSAPPHPKFTARSVRSCKDYETRNDLEVDSWMSKSEFWDCKPQEDKTKQQINNLKSQIDELENAKELQQIDELEIPEHDSENYEDDDINAILQVLEAESQKSQNQIQSLKSIVSTELNATINSIPTCKPDKTDRIGQGDSNNEICSDNFKKESTKANLTDGLMNAKSEISNSSELKPKSKLYTFGRNKSAGHASTAARCIPETRSKSAAECNQNAPKCKDVRIPTPTPKEDIKNKYEGKSNNFKDILTFLDDVEKSSAETLSNVKERVILTNQMVEGMLRLDTIPKLEDLVNHTPAELSNQIIELNLRLKEKSSAIQLLQDELSTLREQIIKTTKQSDKIIKEKIRAQKEQSENMVRRHQTFIDQLIADKQALNQQCETLIHEMKVLEDKYNSNLKAAEHKHNVELQKAKEMHIAGEKIRRERWIDNKTQKIKEMTVKSIEPEIQSMTMRHEQELADLRTLHKREIEDIELKNARKMQQQLESLREQLTEEREKALVHERDVIRQRYESMVESEEKTYQEHRKRLLQEHANRIAECEAKETAMATEKERAIKSIQEEYDDKLQTIVRRHANELEVLKQTTELQLESWKAHWKKQEEAQLALKEQNMKEQCKKERDREIDAVIERLEKEANETKVQIEAQTENRIRFVKLPPIKPNSNKTSTPSPKLRTFFSSIFPPRIKEKYDKEIKDLETSESEAKTKYVENKGKLLETQDEVVSLKANIKSLESQLKDVQTLYQKLCDEKCHMKQNLKLQMFGEICNMEREIEKVKNDRDLELQQVYARVKVTVARKDEMLTELSRDHIALKEKCKYLESMLEQQRKEYLIK